MRKGKKHGREDILRVKLKNFPGGPVVKNPSASAEDMGLIPGRGRFDMPRGN